MKMTVLLESARQLGPNVWVTSFNPAEANVFRGSPKRFGDTSIVLLDDEPGFDPGEETLSFPLAAATLLNIGQSRSAVVINGTADDESPSSPSRADAKGDQHFLKALPPALEKLGKELLFEVRKIFDGQLIYHSNSKKFVETMNFWTVRIQPRDVSLRITVYGLPESFDVKPRALELKPDMSSYSSFKIKEADQLPIALKVIEQAYEKKIAKIRRHTN